MTSIRVREANWAGDREALQAIRREVFMEEQGVPAELEWDGLDATARHLLAETADGTPIGCARLLDDGHLGRMAVLATHRGRGAGTALLATALAIYRDAGLSEVWLDAQVHAVPFYTRAGFTAHGAAFMDAGIPHRRMQLSLT